MSNCSICLRSFEGDRCPNCGGLPASSPQRSKQPFGFYPLLPLAGFLGSLFTLLKYSMVDRTPIMITCVVIYFASIIPQMLFVQRGRPATHVEFVRASYKWAGSVLVAMAFILLANGALDTVPPTQFHATVFSKRLSHGSRGGTSYYLTVSPSWRRGEIVETVEVNGATYSSVRDGQGVSIELHNGLFHLPWYGKILPL